MPPQPATLLRLGGFPAQRRRSPLPPLILLADVGSNPLPAMARLPRGSLVLFRHYGAADRAERAHRLAAFCRARGLRFLVAGDGALAMAVGADGLHLPEWLARGPVSRGWAWRRRKPGWLLTASAHSETALARAAAFGADAVLLAPLFPTPSHPGAKTLGVLRFARFAHNAAVPVYGLGGIGPATIRRLRGSGAAGVAVLSALADKKPGEGPRH